MQQKMNFNFGPIEKLKLTKTIKTNKVSSSDLVFLPHKNLGLIYCYYYYVLI